MIRYKLYQNNNPASNTHGKWYARAVCEETVSLEQLAEHMSNHNTPYSKGCIYGVLRDMVSCVKELILDGKNVKLDDLAIFSAGLRTKPALTAADFAASANITDVRLRARATGILRTPQLTTEARVKQFALYTAGQDTKPSGGGSASGGGESTGG